MRAASQQVLELRYEVPYFATVFLPMHVQGNQNVPICLEEKQRCARTEQRKQLAHEVLLPFNGNAAMTRRGSLYQA